MTDSDDFYEKTVPNQFNQTLQTQRERGPEGADALESMQSVNATIKIDAEQSGSPTLHYLNIANGEMTAGKEPSHPPFMALSHDENSFEAIRAHSRGSVLGFLAGLAGLEDDLKLTLQRVDSLAELNSALRFSLQGNEGFSIVARFGACEADRDVECEIQLDEATYAELKEGSLTTEDAFLSGRVAVQGDMQLAIALALATIAPD